MCEKSDDRTERQKRKTIPLKEAVGTVLAHDVTEIRPGEFKGAAFRKGHVIREQDICHLQRLGKENLSVLNIGEDEMHEDDAASALARALMGEGVAIKGEPREGKIDIIAEKDGLLKIDREHLLRFNMLGEVMCATLHDNTVVRKGQVVAGTRAIPLVVKRKIIDQAAEIANSVKTKHQSIQGSEDQSGKVSNGDCIKDPDALTLCHSDTLGSGVISVRGLRKPRAGVVITGNEVYYGRIKDAFGSIITEKVQALGGEIGGIYYAPDDEAYIEARLRELLSAGCDLLITTGGMSVDPDDVTRFAIRNLGIRDIAYGSAVLPGAMFLVAYYEKSEERRAESITASEIDSSLSALGSSSVPILGIPACGMYAKATVFDLVLPRVLAGERIGREELAELGHGGLCMKCGECRYPVCPFGKA